MEFVDWGFLFRLISYMISSWVAGILTLLLLSIAFHFSDSIPLMIIALVSLIWFIVTLFIPQATKKKVFKFFSD